MTTGSGHTMHTLAYQDPAVLTRTDAHPLCQTRFPPHSWHCFTRGNQHFGPQYVSINTLYCHTDVLNVNETERLSMRALSKRLDVCPLCTE